MEAQQVCPLKKSEKCDFNLSSLETLIVHIKEKHPTFDLIEADSAVFQMYRDPINVCSMKKMIFCHEHFFLVTIDKLNEIDGKEYFVFIVQINDTDLVASSFVYDLEVSGNCGPQKRRAPTASMFKHFLRAGEAMQTFFDDSHTVWSSSKFVDFKLVISSVNDVS